MYLHEELEDADGHCWKFVGKIKGKTFPTGRLVRFGYVTVQRNESEVEEIQGSESGSEVEKTGWLLFGEKIRAHEFHYWDSTENGSDCLAVKPDGKRQWTCMHLEENLVAGYPHLYYPSCRQFVEQFVEKCSAKDMH